MTLFPILHTYSMVYSIFFMPNANYVLRKNKYGCMDQNDCWENLGIAVSNELENRYSG